MIWMAYALVALSFVAIFTREVIAPASRATCNRRWQILATTLNLAQAAAVIATGWLVAGFLGSASLLEFGVSLHPLAGGALTFLIASFIAYWWHRATHRFDLLWRVFHQMHHSPQRVEAHTAFFVHPLDAAAATIITALVGYGLLGVGAAAMAVALVLAGLFNLLIHADVATPRWWGWFVQRPEMHRVHHQRGHHADNYGLPLWDGLFGTLNNPAAFVERCGFDDDKTHRIADMLVFRDVHAETAPPSNGRESER